jgi:hypothetical protein
LNGKIEEFDRKVVEKALGLSVVINDDQSQDSMYDLRVGPNDSVDFAIECVRATDPQLRAVFGALRRRPPLTGLFSFHWTIELGRNANVKNLYKQLPTILAELETHGLDSTHDRAGFLPRHHFLLDELEALGVSYAYRNPHKTAKIIFLPPASGGAVDEYGESVPQWINEFLCRDRNADVISKLRRAKATRKEVFIRADEYGVPWSVASYLTDDFTYLPATDPIIPDGINGVWLIYGSRGLRFDGASWNFVGMETND